MLIHLCVLLHQPQNRCQSYVLFDIQRFCTDSIRFGPISVDPTFDLGDFCVTVISFCNLMLKNRRTGKNPVMLGPMMVRRRKLFSTYHFFASSLVSLNPTSILRNRWRGMSLQCLCFTVSLCHSPQMLLTFS